MGDGEWPGEREWRMGMGMGMGMGIGMGTGQELYGMDGGGGIASL